MIQKLHRFHVVSTWKTRGVFLSFISDIKCRFTCSEKKPVLSHISWTKYYIQSCLKIFILFHVVIMIQISEYSSVLVLNRKIYHKMFITQSWKFSNVDFWPKLNMRNSYRQLLNLNLFRNVCLLFRLNAWGSWCSKIIKDVKILKFK